MKINWQSIVDAVAAIYKAFFKGKVVGGVVLPSEGHTPPLKGSPFDSKPAPIEPPQVGGKWPLP